MKSILSGAEERKRDFDQRSPNQRSITSLDQRSITSHNRLVHPNRSTLHLLLTQDV